MRNRFDELAKQIGETALAPCGTTTSQDRLTAEPLFADLRHEPLPDRDAERARLGLLGRLASTPCIVEVYSRAPTSDDFRACMVKHLVFWQQRARRTEPPPHLWMIAAGTPRAVIDALPFAASGGWPTGVYLLGRDVLRIGLVIASELPVDGSTLLVRLMAGGRLLTSAIPEVRALPPDAPARRIAEPALLQLRHVLERTPDPKPEEQEFIMVMHKTWEDARHEGRAEGRVEGRRELLRTLIATKFGTLTSDTEARLAAASSDELDRYAERILVADSLAVLFAA